jgi:pimeloyl-ACP methyl ester carboxylesterase
MKTRKMTVSRGVFNIRYGGDEDGVPVLMLHGWPESSYCWEGVAAHLNPSLRIIAPDLRGLGESERTLDTKAYQKVELAKDMAEIINALQIDTFLLVGHDWGGVVAQELAFLLPKRVKQLILMNIVIINNRAASSNAKKIIYSHGAVPFWYQYFQQQPGLAEAMIKGNEEVWVRYFFGKAGIDGTIPSETIAEYIRCYSIENTPATGASYYRTMAYDERRWATLGEIKFPMPSLYIYGNLDPVIIPEYLNNIENGFESVKVESLRASHFVQDERPREVALLMNEFFKEKN